MDYMSPEDYRYEKVQMGPVQWDIFVINKDNTKIWIKENGLHICVLTNISLLHSNL